MEILPEEEKAEKILYLIIAQLNEVYKRRIDFIRIDSYNFSVRPGSQVGRQRSAKPLFAGSNPAQALNIYY